jgi:hypothetical protein
VDLLFETAYARPVRPHHDEQILGVESPRLIFVDDFNMREPLTIGADLVLAFDDKNPVGPQNAMCLSTGLEIQVEYGIVPSWSAIGGFAI